MCADDPDTCAARSLPRPAGDTCRRRRTRRRRRRRGRGEEGRPLARYKRRAPSPLGTFSLLQPAAAPPLRIIASSLQLLFSSEEKTTFYYFYYLYNIL